MARALHYRGASHWRHGGRSASLEYNIWGWGASSFSASGPVRPNDLLFGDNVNGARGVNVLVGQQQQDLLDRDHHSPSLWVGLLLRQNRRRQQRAHAVFPMSKKTFVPVALVLSLTLGACSTSPPPAKAGDDAPAPRQSAGPEPVEEPGPQQPSSGSSPVPSPYCAVRTPAGQCFESKEQACAALRCPNDCSYLYGGGADPTPTVACN